MWRNGVYLNLKCQVMYYIPQASSKRLVYPTFQTCMCTWITSALAKKMWILMEPGSGVQEVWGPPFEYGGQLTSDQTVPLKGQRVHASWTRSWFFWFTALFSLYWELYFTFIWYFQSTLMVLELRHTTKRVKYFLLTSKCETRPPYL